MKKENIENMLNNFKIVIRNDLDYLLRTQNCKDLLSYITDLQQENQKYKEVIDKAIEYMKDFIFEPLLTNEDRKLIMYNDNLRNFEKILKEVE